MENMFVLHSGWDLLLNHVHKLFTLEWPCLSLFSTQKSCSESESRIMRFFCTAGRGTEIFAHKEISDEINNNPDSVCIIFIYCLLLSRISSKFLWIGCQNCTGASTVLGRKFLLPPLFVRWIPLWPSYIL